jgi:hypothetical protein
MLAKKKKKSTKNNKQRKLWCFGGLAPGLVWSYLFLASLAMAARLVLGCSMYSSNALLLHLPMAFTSSSL